MRIRIGGFVFHLSNSSIRNQNQFIAYFIKMRFILLLTIAVVFVSGQSHNEHISSEECQIAATDLSYMSLAQLSNKLEEGRAHLKWMEA